MSTLGEDSRHTGKVRSQKRKRKRSEAGQGQSVGKHEWEVNLPIRHLRKQTSQVFEETGKGQANDAKNGIQDACHPLNNITEVVPYQKGSNGDFGVGDISTNVVTGKGIIAVCWESQDQATMRKWRHAQWLVEVEGEDQHLKETKSQTRKKVRGETYYRERDDKRRTSSSTVPESKKEYRSRWKENKMRKIKLAAITEPNKAIPRKEIYRYLQKFGCATETD
ncbi:hypothetical protein BDZ89DRAFT_1052151 [Hymenopellis radicata]|nr:hypothetical protein BDZ89DRAFT_1052151 [Hymenopellis radicata]